MTKQHPLSYESGFKKGAEHARRRFKGEKGLENPFEPNHVEYEAYWDGYSEEKERIAWSLS